jgi:DNA polymerase I
LSKFSIICAETSVVKIKGFDHPCVMLLGRDENLKRLKLRQSFLPYFYLTEADYLKIKDTAIYKSWHVQKIERVPQRNLFKRILVKIYVTDCGRIGESIKSINKWNKQGEVKEKALFTYEADLSKYDLLPLRFLIDKGIKSGVEVNGNEVGKPIDFIVPLREWLIDFEAYTFKEYTSGLSPKDPVYMVTIFDSYEKKLYTFYVNNSKWNVERQTNQMFKPFPTGFIHEIRRFETEAQFFDALVDLVIDKDPDLFSAWNLNRYDFPKWKQRMDLLKGKCIHTFSDISPMHSVISHSRPMRVKGRIGFDLMVAYKQFTDQEMDEYNLAYVSKYEELHVDKIPFKGTSGHTWDVAPDIAFQRNVNDVLIMIALEEKYHLIDNFDDLRTEFGALFHETFVRHRIIDTALMRLVSGKIALSTTNFSVEKEGKLLGAVVVAPEPDEYQNVFQFDFGREYPSLIKGLNISPDTYSDKPTEKCYHVVYDWVDPINGGNKHFECYFDKSKVGLLPQLINFFFRKRDEYDKGLKKAIANGDSEGEIRRWERKQYNMKKTTNAIYGVMDYPKFRLHKSECTQATAIMARISIEEEKRYLAEIGYTLLYGDTDSFFVIGHSKTKEDLLVEGKALQKQLNEHLTKFLVEKYGVEKAPAELGFKKIYDNIMFIAKKNYIGRSIWDEKKGWKEELDVKGVASVRSDASMLEKSTIKEIGKMCVTKAQDEVIRNFVATVLQRFDNHEYDYIEMSYPAQIKKELKQNDKGDWVSGYKTTLPAHIKSAIYSNMVLNTDFKEGDKPRRLSILISKQKKLRGKRAKEQQKLFDIPTIEPYPTKLMIQGKERKLTDISIVPDMMIPKYFIDHINYERIKKRLEGKINKLLSIHFKEEDEKENDK